jgi:hypothetical protein
MLPRRLLRSASTLLTNSRGDSTSTSMIDQKRVGKIRCEVHVIAHNTKNARAC